MTNQSDTARPIAGALSLAGLLALFVTAIDWASAVWPFNPGELSWRYGATGITAGFTVTAAIGLVLLAMGQLASDRTTSVRFLGYVAAAIAGILGLALIIFMLDGLQMSGLNDPARRTSTMVVVAIAALKLLGAILVFGGVGRGLLRAARAKTTTDTRMGPIVGAPSAKR